MLAAARARRRMEAEHEPELACRNADRRELGHALAEHHPQRPAAGDRALLGELRRREIRLAHDVRDFRSLAPPVAGLVAGVRGARHEQNRPRAEVREGLEVEENVAAVLRVRLAPRRDQARAVELVLGNHRARASHRERGRRVHALRAVDDHRRVERLERRADAPDEVHVPVDGLRAVAPVQLRVDVVRGRGDHAAMRERLPEGDAGVGEVDPERALRHRAGARGGSAMRRGGKPRAQRERDDQKPPHRPAVKVAVRETRLTHASRTDS